MCNTKFGHSVLQCAAIFVLLTMVSPNTALAIANSSAAGTVSLEITGLSSTPAGFSIELDPLPAFDPSPVTETGNTTLMIGGSSTTNAVNTSNLGVGDRVDYAASLSASAQTPPSSEAFGLALATSQFIVSNQSATTVDIDFLLTWDIAVDASVVPISNEIAESSARADVELNVGLPNTIGDSFFEVELLTTDALGAMADNGSLPFSVTAAPGSFGAVNPAFFPDVFARSTPEPSTFGLATLGLVSLGMIGWRRRKRA